ncbi:MAG: hypothetical protein HFI06_10620 [Eubacterium sp.]|jgi:hypothetical protein|nr:hypothetical protein [Eubacterium sp.]NBI87773.1 hypothetical protein [Lachnospiraceae bacterium]
MTISIGKFLSALENFSNTLYDGVELYPGIYAKAARLGHFLKNSNNYKRIWHIQRNEITAVTGI